MYFKSGQNHGENMPESRRPEDTKQAHGLLLSRQEILIIGVIIRTLFISALQKAVHFILVEIDKADITLIFLVINIIGAFITDQNALPPLNFRFVLSLVLSYSYMFLT